jgi:hypothetical protein
MSGTQARLDAIRAHVCEARRMRTQWTDRELILTEDAELLLAELERVTAALREYQDCASWYIRCLEDVQDRRPVRGLAEAKAGYDSARAALAGGARAAQEGEQ